jgi:hypothetical protein
MEVINEEAKDYKEFSGASFNNFNGFWLARM